MADRPRTFAEVVAAESPEERARWERAESYSDAAVANDFHAEVWVIEDRNHPGEWLRRGRVGRSGRLAAEQSPRCGQQASVPKRRDARAASRAEGGTGLSR